MYPWEKVVPSQDSTLRIIHEAIKRGYHVSITTPSNLTIRECYLALGLFLVAAFLHRRRQQGMRSMTLLHLLPEFTINTVLLLVLLFQQVSLGLALTWGSTVILAVMILGDLLRSSCDDDDFDDEGRQLLVDKECTNHQRETYGLSPVQIV